MQSEASQIPTPSDAVETPAHGSFFRVSLIILGIVFGPAMLAWVLTMLR
jgi:hypothetical protein